MVQPTSATPASMTTRNSSPSKPPVSSSQSSAPPPTSSRRAKNEQGIIPRQRCRAVFEIRQRDGLARIGRLTTPHGALETPTLLPVVNPRKLTLKPAEIRDCGATGLITNSYIISRHDELRERALADGVHALLGWDGPLMTDSGTFQSHVYGDIEVEPQAIVEFQRDIGSDIGTVLDVFTEPEFDADRAEAELAETQTRIAAAVPLKG